MLLRILNDRIKKSFEGLAGVEMIRCNQLEYHDIIDRDSHAEIIEKIYEDETTCLSEKDLLFSNPNFTIIPMVCVYI